MGRPRKYASDADRLRAWRARRQQEAAETVLFAADEVCALHLAAVKAARDGDGFAMQIVGGSSLQTLENLVDYLKCERGRLCYAPAPKAKAPAST